jgi:hypothetical protein
MWTSHPHFRLQLDSSTAIPPCSALIHSTKIAQVHDTSMKTRQSTATKALYYDFQV